MATLVALRAPNGSFANKTTAWKRFLVRAQKASGPRRHFVSVRSRYVSVLAQDKKWTELHDFEQMLKTELDKLDPVLLLTVNSFEGTITVSHGNVLGE